MWGPTSCPFPIKELATYPGFSLAIPTALAAFSLDINSRYFFRSHTNTASMF